jgi:hypothetical protein
MYMLWYMFWYMVDVHVMVQVLVHGLCTWYGDGFDIHLSGSSYSWLISCKDNDMDSDKESDRLYDWLIISDRLMR